MPGGQSYLGDCGALSGGFWYTPSRHFVIQGVGEKMAAWWETVYHLGSAAICWAIWKCRNKACFDKKLIKHPTDIMFHACSFMIYWAGLYNSELRGKLMDDVKTCWRVLTGYWRNKLRTIKSEKTVASCSVTDLLTWIRLGASSLSFLFPSCSLVLNICISVFSWNGNGVEPRLKKTRW
jgi:hypothetical protein